MKVVFDIDYRPNLWGLAGHNAGEERYIASDTVSEKLRDVLPHCDLIVGTEEEITLNILGDLFQALMGMLDKNVYGEFLQSSDLLGLNGDVC